MATGIVKRHSKGCPSRDGGRCRCNAGYEASVFSKKEGKKIRKTFAREAEAKTWRADALGAVAKGALRTSSPTTVKQAWDAWHEGAKAGTITNRSGDPYKPSTLRSYERAMRLRFLPKFGPVRLTDLEREALQEFVDDLLADEVDPSVIKMAVQAPRPMLRRAKARGQIVNHPCEGLELPSVRGQRERFASPVEASTLIGALPEDQQALWATAMYGGLRRGELQALREDAIDLAAGIIRVRKGWDQVEGEIELKTSSGKRKVPIAPMLRDYLIAHRLRCGAAGDALTFGRTAHSPFDPKAVQKPADKAWKAAKLERITPHECRHTFASLMIAAGVNAKALQTFMGHSSITITYDRYGHLMPGSEAEAADLLHDYLSAAHDEQVEQARGLTGAPDGAPLAHELVE